MRRYVVPMLFSNCDVTMCSAIFRNQVSATMATKFKVARSVKTSVNIVKWDGGAYRDF